ncbi:MAG: CBS domain-containing protein [Gammaproteobacteria bacterium]|nr:MAG: CBS domain-containing protein [Gammaproteobacteria bacterium]
MIPYRALPARRLPAGAGYCRPGGEGPVGPDSPALEAMTDFTRVRPVSIGPEATVPEANRRMMAAGVRLLLVVDAEDRLLGLVSAADVLGERPLQVATRRRVSAEEVQVAEIMTPREELEVLDLQAVAQARVGDVVDTLRRLGRQHVLVMEETAGGPRVRGLFSATQIGRQLGVPIHLGDMARTFAELEAALAPPRALES